MSMKRVEKVRLLNTIKLQDGYLLMMMNIYRQLEYIGR